MTWAHLIAFLVAALLMPLVFKASGPKGPDLL